MKRAALAGVVLSALATPASGELAVGPHGWTYDEGMSVELTRKAQRGTYFGAVAATQIQVEAFRAPTAGALFVTRVAAPVAAAQRNAAATHAVFGLVEGARRQGAAQIEASGQRADPGTKELEATITWRDPAGVRQIARTIVAADETNMVAFTGECVLPSEAAAGVEQACAAALAKLDTGIAASQRVGLSIVDAPAETELPPIATAPPVETLSPSGMSSPSARMGEPRLTDGARTPMAPMTISPAKREVDKRPLYLGAGIVLLAALFWWNRRQRDRFDRDRSDRAHGPTPVTTEPEPSSGDDDADDLQAAARGAAPKDEP